MHGGSPFALPSVATWFQVDIDSCAFRKPACLFECQYFGVPDSIVAVIALAHDDPILHNDGTHQRVWLLPDLRLWPQLPEPDPGNRDRDRRQTRLSSEVKCRSNCLPYIIADSQTPTSFRCHLSTPCAISVNMSALAKSLNSLLVSIACRASSANEPSVVARVEA